MIAAVSFRVRHTTRHTDPLQTHGDGTAKSAVRRKKTSMCAEKTQNISDICKNTNEIFKNINGICRNISNILSLFRAVVVIRPERN